VSRIGRAPIAVPAGVQVQIAAGEITVKGPKGQLSRVIPADIVVSQQGSVLQVTRPDDEREHRSLHGLTRALVANMVQGVSAGYTRGMEIEGVGYRAELKGTNLVLLVGYSHPVEIEPPQGISFDVDKTGRTFSIMGIDKEMVGEVAARVRRVRPPEPYKGKGIRYAGEQVRRKAGKAGKVGTGA
jgi:large subunit ribosomal protein L6